ncbi:MAG: DNA polymerase III subunit delta [Anaerolineae bacterium]|nr:DNA polymerase III subunit delta [Anaerolineae bacterium]
MITLLHGPDDLLRSEHLATLRAALGPAEMAELSTTWLDGRRTTTGEIRHHADAMPFLTPRRLVIVEGYLLQLRRRMRSSKGKTDDEGDDSDTPENLSAAAQDREHLLAYLSEVPDTTDLVLVEATTVPGNDKLIKALKRLANEGRAAIVVCDAPAERDLPGWIIDRTRRKGGEIEPAAAYDLATSVGRNLMLLDNELDKLIAYRGGAGPIRKTDVRLMVPYTQEASIFDMVDAIGQKNSAEATRLLRELERDGAAPLYLLAMIVRQFRILVQVTDLQDSGLDKYEIGSKIGLHHYPTGKAMQQSRRWRMDALLAAYDRLLETDLAIKTGKLPDDLALDLLVLGLCETPR